MPSLWMLMSLLIGRSQKTTSRGRPAGEAAMIEIAVVSLLSFYAAQVSWPIRVVTHWALA
jgi:hypothetical protein